MLTNTAAATTATTAAAPAAPATASAAPASGAASPANAQATAAQPASAPPAAAATADQGPQNKLVFYSLYMHLLPYSGYLPSVGPTTTAATRNAPPYWESSHKITGTLKAGCNARNDPANGHIGNPIHVLPADSTVEIQQEQQLKLGSKKQAFVQVKILTLGTGNAGTLSVGQLAWISGQSKFLARDLIQPDVFDSVVVCEQPHPISAGDPIGYLGLYETPSAGANGKTSRKQVHIELFTGDSQFDDFYANKAGLTDGKKLKVAGTDAAPAAMSVTTFTPGSDRLILPVVVDVTPALAKQDAQHKNWFPVQGIGDNGLLSGYVAESQLKDAVQYDWEKLGFRKVEETNDNADGYMDPEKVPAFFKKIYSLIDRNTDNDITPDELLAANQNPVVRDALAHVIAKHPSEWQGASGAAKWNVLKDKDALLRNDPKRLKHEQDRIDKLTWWDAVSGVTDFPESPNVWHFNPIIFLEYLISIEIITMDMLHAVDPAGTESHHSILLPYLNEYAQIYEITTPRRIAHFLSQVAHESNLRVVEEGLNYRPKVMRETFGCKSVPHGSHGTRYNAQTDECNFGRLREKLWTHEDYYAHNPEHLANYVYANRMNNGDEASGDGYKYRGRGLLQVTGKVGYTNFQNEHNRRNPQNIQNFVQNPDLLIQNTEYGVESAFVFWSLNNLNATSDTGTVANVTQVVNGGQHGYGDRKSRYNHVAPLLGLAQEQ